MFRLTQNMLRSLDVAEMLISAFLNNNTFYNFFFPPQSAPYKTGSKGTKAQRAKQLGLEPAAISLIENPVELSLFSYIKPNVKGKYSVPVYSNGN